VARSGAGVELRRGWAGSGHGHQVRRADQSSALVASCGPHPLWPSHPLRTLERIETGLVPVHGLLPHAETVRVEVAPGHAYWSVLSGPGLTVVEPIDSFLRHLRFGKRRAEGTTKTYAGHLKRFEQWRLSHGATWEDAARDLASYIISLRINPRTTPGRGQGRGPSEAALAPALAAIHGFFWHAVDVGDVDRSVLAGLFEAGGAPAPHAGRHRVEGPRPRLRVDPRPSQPVDLGPPAATVEEFAALLGAATTARDACMVGFLGGLGLRVGQVASARREDVHLVPPGRRVPGCGYQHGPHLHINKRDDHPRGATSKSRDPVVIPVAAPVEMLYAAWLRERLDVPRAAECPWVFVSFDGPAGNRPGEPLSSRRIHAIVDKLANDAGVRHIHPHMLRHSFGEAAADLDVARDVLQRLLGQRTVEAQDVYRRVPIAKVIDGATAVTSRLVNGSGR
jgi:integrase/recombinase XerD